MAKYLLNFREEFQTPVGRFQYLYLFRKPNVFKDKNGAESSRAYWSADVFYDPEDPVVKNFISQVKDFFAAQRATEKRFLEEFKKANAKLINPEDIDRIRVYSSLKKPGKTEEGEAVHAKLNAKTGCNPEWPSEGRPAYFNRAGELLSLEAAEKLIYAGCYGRIRGMAHTSFYNEQGNVLYVTYRPRAIQFYQDGDLLGGGLISSMEGFDPPAGDEAAQDWIPGSEDSDF